jgi:hypothetical protein
VHPTKESQQCKVTMPKEDKNQNGKRNNETKLTGKNDRKLSKKKSKIEKLQKVPEVLAAILHFYPIFTSCPHKFFGTLDFHRNLRIKQHYYFAHLRTCLCSHFHDCKRENFDFEVTLKSSLDYFGHSCLCVHCIFNLIIVAQLARHQNLYSFGILLLLM